MGDAFDRAVSFVLDIEGGFVENENDPGGKTKWGISQRAYPDIDIENLTREQAVEIYQRDYWNKCRCDELPEPVAFVAFDEAVNQGVYASVKDLQEAVGVKVDGVIGPVTLAAVAKCNPVDIVEHLTAERIERYVWTAINHSMTDVFIKGWIRRAVNCMRKALE